MGMNAGGQPPAAGVARPGQAAQLAPGAGGKGGVPPSPGMASATLGNLQNSAAGGGMFNAGGGQGGQGQQLRDWMLNNAQQARATAPPGVQQGMQGMQDAGQRFMQMMKPGAQTGTGAGMWNAGGGQAAQMPSNAQQSSLMGGMFGGGGGGPPMNQLASMLASQPAQPMPQQRPAGMQAAAAVPEPTAMRRPGKGGGSGVLRTKPR